MDVLRLFLYPEDGGIGGTRTSGTAPGFPPHLRGRLAEARLSIHNLWTIDMAVAWFRTNDANATAGSAEYHREDLGRVVQACADGRLIAVGRRDRQALSKHVRIPASDWALPLLKFESQANVESALFEGNWAEREGDHAAASRWYAAADEAEAAREWKLDPWHSIRFEPTDCSLLAPGVSQTVTPAETPDSATLVLKVDGPRIALELLEKIGRAHV